jgi:hypothetical protein
MRYTTYRDQTPSDPPEDFVVGVLWLVVGSCRTFSEVNTKKSRANYNNETHHPRKITEEVWVTEITSKAKETLRVSVGHVGAKPRWATLSWVTSYRAYSLSFHVP